MQTTILSKINFQIYPQMEELTADEGSCLVHNWIFFPFLSIENLYLNTCNSFYALKINSSVFMQWFKTDFPF